MALPGLTDDPFTVFAVRDANEANLHTFAQWQAMGSARSMDEFIDAHRSYNAMPWVNTIAASADGRAVYIDNSNVGALSEEAILSWHNTLKAVPKLQYLYLARGLVILDGSQQSNEWLETSSPVPHTEPFERRPLIESDQYVFNANDSYWLSDPDKPAAALSPLYGPTMTPRSVRTRMNIALLRPDSPYGHAGDDGKLNRDEMQTALFSNESLTADMLLPELLDACETNPERSIETDTIDLTEACKVLAAWDRRFNSESRGAVLFREWITQYPADETYLGSSLFQQPFNPMEAATTPSGLANADLALDRLARAVRLLDNEGIGLDTALGNLQIGHRYGRQYPIHGGNRHEGIANLQMSTAVGNNPTETPIFTGSGEFAGDSDSLSKSGYNVVHGSSFIMTLGWSDVGPEAEAILSYSQSGDPESPHFDDQTQLYAEKSWRPVRFTPTDIETNAVSRRVLRSID
jgi:acyl-homoserine-lactone acylase